MNGADDYEVVTADAVEYLLTARAGTTTGLADDGRAVNPGIVVQYTVRPAVGGEPVTRHLVASRVQAAVLVQALDAALRGENP